MPFAERLGLAENVDLLHLLEFVQVWNESHSQGRGDDHQQAFFPRLAVGVDLADLLDVPFTGIDPFEQSHVADEILQFHFHVDVQRSLIDIGVEPDQRQPVDVVGRSVAQDIVVDEGRHSADGRGRGFLRTNGCLRAGQRRFVVKLVFAIFRSHSMFCLCVC